MPLASVKRTTSKSYTHGMAVHLFHRARVVGLGLGLSLSGLTVVAVPSALAQVTQKIVSGKVVNKGGGAIRNAVVYLKDDRTLAVKSFISDDNGGYRFGQLAQGTDYELWAEADGKKSSVKTVSSFDSKATVTVDLKIDK